MKCWEFLDKARNFQPERTTLHDGVSEVNNNVTAVNVTPNIVVKNFDESVSDYVKIPVSLRSLNN